MGVVKVIKPGLLTTIQDLGRINFQKSGMPVSGAMDSYSLKAANILAGNNEGEACLEATLIGPELKFSGESVIAITGGNLTPQINGVDVDMWSAIKVKGGDVLSFGTVKSGCRSYVSIAGGIDVPAIMGSKSTYIRGHIGGFEGRPLKAGDELKTGTQNQNKAYKPVKLPGELIPTYNKQIVVRVVLGPQDDYFSEEGINTFFSSEYKVTNEADRMGYRLEGPKIVHENGADIISDGITMGSIQVPGHEIPIIMMADRQTTGGYTKIATAIAPDLDLIGQLKPGDSIRFAKICIKDAQIVYKEYVRRLDNIKSFVDNCNVISSRKFKVKVNSREFELLVQEIK